jgi:hypothetical protein
MTWFDALLGLCVCEPVIILMFGAWITEKHNKGRRLKDFE